ncbi:MAG TPA: DUF6428 family protein [Flavobacteriaceae bacterium]|nr:hypothetical protein [Flavobacteriaceae bacterium]MCB9212158.1 hypothetical protein [Alteromonas sp.]HPF10464.1 DUF6428 family protein [Flavobacteriaceae bacterium]HQU21773.1 DUF6428 family protein [Flavobacteriaceae bacterium]HQU64675.1 DUF6428 family protein [Flavobacteriaceae bacterium]
MKTLEFLSLLEQHKDKTLLFEYAPQKWVGANYHITEVKHLHVESVDCGSGMDAWNETIVQLWESPSEKDKTKYMTAFKALSILKKVGKMKPYDMEAEIKFEYSNPNFHLTQLRAHNYCIEGNELQLTLGLQKTDCKAKETCGIPESKSETQAPCCTPGSGCC